MIGVISCDDDFNSVGSEVIGGVNFEDDSYTSIPIAFNRRFERVQTSGLPNNLLGVYNDPVYGQSIYNVLSQVIPTTLSPSFGNGAMLDSIVLDLPYFSNLVETQIDDNGATTNIYELDSIYGTDPINLSIYQSNRFLRDFDLDQGAEEPQIYYSNDVIDNFGPSVEGTLLKTIDDFFPSDEEVILTTLDGIDADEDGQEDVTATTETPRLRVLWLPEDAEGNINDQAVIDHFTEQFLDREGSIELSNANNFYNFFRGIYFRAEPINGNGNLTFFDISTANITLHYSFDTTQVDEEDEDGDGNTTEFTRNQGELLLNFSNNIVNSIETDFNPVIEEELIEQDEVNGEENLYLKGGEGSFAVIDLFTNDVLNENGELENEFDFIQRQNWLINEASMKLYINQDQVTGGILEPERIFIFELETGNVLIDYFTDFTGNPNEPIESVTEHLGRISRGSDENGEFYKIRLTQHVIEILEGNSENVTLALSVSQNVNLIDIAQGFTPVNIDEEITPLSSVISHEGTVLYGNGDNVPEEKRLQLDIFFTESTNN